MHNKSRFSNYLIDNHWLTGWLYTPAAAAAAIGSFFKIIKLFIFSFI
jgi:hypothetical protein